MVALQSDCLFLGSSTTTCSQSIERTFAQSEKAVLCSFSHFSFEDVAYGVPKILSWLPTALFFFFFRSLTLVVMDFGGGFRRGAWRHWRGASRSVPRLAVAAGVLAGVPGAMERRPLKFETLEERVRVLETKLRAMELNDLEEMRELALVAALGDFSGNSIL